MATLVKFPFSPEILDAMPEELAELYRSLEITLLKNISDRLVSAGDLNEVTVQQIRALRSHGISLKDIEKAIQNVTGLSQQKLDELFADVVRRNQGYYNSLITISDVTAPQILVGREEIDALIRQTRGELMNITRSMGFVVGNQLIPPAQAYQWALDNSAMQIESGAVSYGQAIANATRQLADSGLQYVDYESGWRNRVDVAVRRATLTGISQLNRKYDEQAMEILETDLVEVSAHAGARDQGVGFENHESWQGKVYRWQRYTDLMGQVSTGQYPDFEDTCGYGDVQGILGANCRHSFHAFVEGVMERTYTDDQLRALNKPPFKYEGRTYTTYEATQKQRQIETAVRHWKRREAAATNADDRAAAKARIRALNAKYREFSNAAGLRMQRERMRVYVG